MLSDQVGGWFSSVTRLVKAVLSDQVGGWFSLMTRCVKGVLSDQVGEGCVQ